MLQAWNKSLISIATDLQRKLSTISWEEELGKWIELHGLGRVKDPVYVISIQLSFNALGRVILYEKYVGKVRDGLSFSDMADDEGSALGIDAIKAYDLDRILDKLLDINARESLIQKLSNIVKRYSREDARNDMLGALYEELIPSAERRRLGQFFTPIPVADLMVEYLLRNIERGKIVDPAVGTGRFILRLLSKDRYATERYELIGIDISPLMILLSIVNISYLSTPERIRFRLGDMFDFDELISGSDAIISNPPYSRHHELSLDYKRKLQEKVRITTNVMLSRYTSFFGYALLYLSSLLKRNGYMSFICPVEIFEAKYSNEIKKYLASNKLLEKVVVFSEKSFIFPYAENAASIIFIHKDSPRNVHFIKIKEMPNVESLEKILDINSEGSFEWFFVRKVDNKELLSLNEWKIFYTDEETTSIFLKEIIKCPMFVPFKHIAKIMRGIATGANDFFLLSEIEVKKWRIEKEFLKPALAKTRWVLGYVYNKEIFDQIKKKGEKCWLLYCMLSPSTLSNENVLEYIKHGERLGLPKRSLIRLRRVWYQVEKREPPPIVFTYLSKSKPRFIYNEIGAMPLNTFLCIYPTNEISNNRKMLKALLAYLNSDIAYMILKIKGRSYGGDTLKIEPRELDELPVLDVRKLRREEIETLASLFEKLEHAVNKEEVKKEIDSAILTILEKCVKRQPKRTLLAYLGNPRKV